LEYHYITALARDCGVRAALYLLRRERLSSGRVTASATVCGSGTRVRVCALTAHGPRARGVTLISTRIGISTARVLRWLAASYARATDLDDWARSRELALLVGGIGAETANK
jgi:hypothetical protein